MEIHDLAQKGTFPVHLILPYDAVLWPVGSENVTLLIQLLRFEIFKCVIVSSLVILAKEYSCSKLSYKPQKTEKKACTFLCPSKGIKIDVVGETVVAKVNFILILKAEQNLTGQVRHFF